MAAWCPWTDCKIMDCWEQIAECLMINKTAGVVVHCMTVTQNSRWCTAWQWHRTAGGVLHDSDTEQQVVYCVTVTQNSRWCTAWQWHRTAGCVLHGSDREQQVVYCMTVTQNSRSCTAWQWQRTCFIKGLLTFSMTYELIPWLICRFLTRHKTIVSVYWLLLQRSFRTGRWWCAKWRLSTTHWTCSTWMSPKSV